MRRFAFLQCIRCRHFQPKRLLPQPALAAPEFLAAVYVGICTAGEYPEWIVWNSLEWATSRMGLCPDRETRPSSEPGCPIFDLTLTSASQPYPDACVYHGTPACPKHKT